MSTAPPRNPGITWLHLSDLHKGQPSGAALRNEVEDVFFPHLRRELEKLGTSIDLVLFTGDLAFRGLKKEYDEMDRFLERLQEALAGSGSEPLILSVPGNHDLVRPAGTAAFPR